jgi:hypothetical protein
LEQPKKPRLKRPQFLIRRISFSTPEAERRRAVEGLLGLCAAGQFEKILEVVGSCLPKDDAGELAGEGERSDVVHDLLSHLAEEMIRMNKEKQEEIRGFLAWPDKVEVEEAVFFSCRSGDSAAGRASAPGGWSEAGSSGRWEGAGAVAVVRSASL